MPLVAENNDCQSSKFEFNNQRNGRSFDHVTQFLRIIEECDTNAKGSLYVCRAIAACYRPLSQEKKGSCMLSFG